MRSFPSSHAVSSSVALDWLPVPKCCLDLRKHFLFSFFFAFDIVSFFLFLTWSKNGGNKGTSFFVSLSRAPPMSAFLITDWQVATDSLPCFAWAISEDYLEFSPYAMIVLKCDSVGDVLDLRSFSFWRVAAYAALIAAGCNCSHAGDKESAPYSRLLWEDSMQ